jgi:hypothetical protein
MVKKNRDIEDIPDSLLEYPVPDTTSKLDKEVESYLEDVKILIEARLKEFQLNGDKKVKLPIIEQQKYLIIYQSI